MQPDTRIRSGFGKLTVAVVLAILALAAIGLIYGLSRDGTPTAGPTTTQPDGETPELLIYVGSSMRQPMEQIIDAYQAGHPEVKIVPSYGDSGDVLAQVQFSGSGEAAILHEPYLTEASQKGWSTNTYVLANMQPIIAVAEGNPKNIHGLRDFARADVKIGMTDARYTTSGQIVQQALADAGIQKQVNDREPYTNRSSGHMAMQVITGALDAATLWDAVAAGHPDKLDIVRIEPELMPDTFTDSDGVTYRDGKVNVGLFTLKTAQYPEQTRQFVEFILSPRGQAIWKANGFNPTITAPAAQP